MDYGYRIVATGPEAPAHEILSRND
jgi:hypothetical protein